MSQHTACSSLLSRVCPDGVCLCYRLEASLSQKLCLPLFRRPLWMCVQISLERGLRPECWVAGGRPGEGPGPRTSQETTQTSLWESCPHSGLCQARAQGPARYLVKPKMI